MERPVFKTFASAEGLKEWALWVFAMAMFVLRGQGLEPSPEAQQTAKSILQADCNDFKGLYRAAAREYHPDKNNDSDTTADMALINNVYEQRKARGGCEKSNLRRKTSEKPDKSDQPKKPKKPEKPKKSKPEKPKKSKPKKPKTSEKRKKTRRKTKEANDDDDGISMGQVLAGVCLGAVVGSVAKECRRGRQRERRPHPSSPGRLTRRTYSSDSE